MKNISIAIILIYCTALVRGDVEMFAEVKIMPAAQQESTKGILVIDVYLKNKTDAHIDFPVKPAGVSTGPDFVLISYGIRKTREGLSIKPHPSYLNTINLGKGEVAELYQYSVAVDFDEEFNVMIKYIVPREMRKFYDNIWVGELSIRIDSTSIKKGKFLFK